MAFRGWWFQDAESREEEHLGAARTAEGGAELLPPDAEVSAATTSERQGHDFPPAVESGRQGHCLKQHPDSQAIIRISLRLGRWPETLAQPPAENAVPVTGEMRAEQGMPRGGESPAAAGRAR
jgi:hypothetical protein